MPQPQNVETVCTGCNCHFFTTQRLASQEHHFHDGSCYSQWRTGRPRSDRGKKAIWKTCQFCDIRFRAGGRDENGKRLPNKKALFHSKVCAGRFKSVKGQKCQLLQINAAEWHSWNFDGEGSAFMVAVPGKRLFPVVSIGSTDRNVILSLIRDTGVGKPTIRKATSPKQKDLYQWRCFAAAATSYLRQILPFSLVKRAVIEQVLRWCGELERNPRLGYLPEWRDEVQRTCKALNARGAKSQRFPTDSRNAEGEIERLICPDLYEPVADLGNSCACSVDKCLCCGKPLPNRRKQTTCSRKCAYKIRKRRGQPCRVIHQSLRTRLAGLVDAEGSIGIARSGRTVHARIDIGNTNERLIRMLPKITGIGSITERPPKKKTHSVSWHWRIQSDGAEGFLEQILPYLRIKSRQAELALTVQRRLKQPKDRVNRDWQSEALAQMKKLNRKGPRLDQDPEAEKEL